MAYERISPGTKEWDLYLANHQFRYKFAISELVREKANRVLDAATGVGYGAGLMADYCTSVIAIDRDASALKVANDHFKKQNIEFIEDDCETLIKTQQFAPFNAIVSFETLEHLKHPEKFLLSAFNQLDKGGILIISTPNQLVSDHVQKKDWKFHEKEYAPEEFVEVLVNSGFSEIELLGQQYTQMGIIRNQLRSELNRIHSNPFMRFGKLIQKVLRGIPDNAVLSEQQDDFDMKRYANASDISSIGKEGPFVLVIKARRL